MRHEIKYMIMLGILALLYQPLFAGASEAVATSRIGSLAVGPHTVTLMVDAADQVGVEIDFVRLRTAEGKPSQ